MRKRRVLKDGPVQAGLMATACVLAIGVVAGSVVASKFAWFQQSFLSGYTAALTDSAKGFWRAFFGLDFFLLLAMLFSGLLRPGRYLACVIMAVKGFYLSALVTSFICEYGLKGYTAAFASVFASALLSLFCLMFMGLQVFRLSGRGSKRRLFRYADKKYLTAFSICIVLLLISAFLESCLAPALTKAALYIIS